MSQYFENDDKVKSNISLKEVTVKNIKYYFYTDNGVFNKSGLDYGTRLLLNNISLPLLIFFILLFSYLNYNIFYLIHLIYFCFVLLFYY